LLDVADWNKNTIDEFRARGGKGIGHFGDKLLLLTTRGARSGRTLTSPVVYHRDGDRYVIAASKGGAPTHPSWYHNLVKHREAEVEGRHRKVQGARDADREGTGARSLIRGARCQFRGIPRLSEEDEARHPRRRPGARPLNGPRAVRGLIQIAR